MKSRMIITNQKRKVIKWDVPEYGLFEATIWDGQLTDFRACKNGSLTETGVCSDDPKFLERVRDTITDLLDQLYLSKGGTASSTTELKV